MFIYEVFPVWRSIGRDITEDDSIRVQAIYDTQRGRLKLILIGSIESTAALLRVIRALVEVEK